MPKSDNVRHFPDSLRRGMRDPILTYAVAAICGLVFLLLCFIGSHGDAISQYFWFDTQDTGMDFFYSIQYVRGREPYAAYSTLYPPLANLLFLIIYRMVPTGESQYWLDGYWGAAEMRMSPSDLRLSQAPMLMFLLFLLGCCWMLTAIVNSILKNHPQGKANLMAACVLFSPGVLFALERGNILLMVLPLTLFFVYFRNDKNPVVRELALISLAVAAGLKLYPALFGILLLRDRKYGQALRAIVYGLAAFLLPSFAFREGLSFLPIWWDVLTNFESNNYAAARFLGISVSGILQMIAYYLNRFAGITVDSSWFSLAGYAVSLALIVSALTCEKNWQRILCITMAMLMVQFQYSYIFCFVSIPMLLFIAEEKQLTKENALPFVCMLLLTVHIPLCFIQRLPYLDVRIRQVVSILLTGWCLAPLFRFTARKITLVRRK